jgi:hypothetical protein
LDEEITNYSAVGEQKGVGEEKAIGICKDFLQYHLLLEEVVFAPNVEVGVAT